MDQYHSDLHSRFCFFCGLEKLLRNEVALILSKKVAESVMGHKPVICGIIYASQTRLGFRESYRKMPQHQ